MVEAAGEKRNPQAGGGVTGRDRLARQLEFCVEVDKVKSVARRNPLTDGSRPENDAEHMWHVALMALVLAEHAAQPVDVARVVSMLVVHDLVEIDAGDVFVYDTAGREAAADREARAAERIFGLLPADQAEWARALWDEFEARETADARFARALDRLQPLLQNVAAGGGAWAIHGITADRVTDVNSIIADASPALWTAAREAIAGAVARGHLRPAPPATG
jgi:putative hydrolase of HD superfamily